MANKNLESLQKFNIEQLKQGFIHLKGQGIFQCLVCGESFEQGQIYPLEEKFYEARKACEIHITKQHENWFDLLLTKACEIGSFSEVQAQIISLSYQGFKDKEIAQKLGGKSPSTIRNHRFQLRAKEKEARLFLAVMDLLNERSEKMSDFIQFHRDMPVQDDRIQITEEEEKTILAKHFSETPSLKLHKFPKKQKHKLVILKRISQLFETEKKYTEKEINYRILEVYDDYVTIRRYLIEYAFLKRKPDGSQYWKEK